MVYISNRRGFKDFFKSRNTKFYIAIMIIFIAVVITTAIIIHKAKSIMTINITLLIQLPKIIFRT